MPRTGELEPSSKGSKDGKGNGYGYDFGRYDNNDAVQGLRLSYRRSTYVHRDRHWYAFLASSEVALVTGFAGTDTYYMSCVTTKDIVNSRGLVREPSDSQITIRQRDP